MDVLFLANLFPPDLRSEIEKNSKFGIQYAADALQWNFIKGFSENDFPNLKIINAPIVGSYPTLYKKISILGCYFDFRNYSKNRSIGYCNIAIIKQYLIRRSLEREVSKWIENSPQKHKVIVVYSMLPYCVLTAVTMKRKYPDIKLCLIIPDLPQYMNDSQNILFKIRSFMIPDLFKYISSFDSFVCLTDSMSTLINNKPWLRIEGIVNSDDLPINTAVGKMSKKKIVLYTGTLAERYGILDLLAAFKLIEDFNYELWICGSGDTQYTIQNIAKSDSRIKFKGSLPREQVLILQSQATVLINPRPPIGEYTKYSFPSKIMEYLLSGTPCIMYMLPGVPEEYRPYIFEIQGSGPESIKKAIVKVCSMDNNELKIFGLKARTFVLKTKNSKEQVRKLLLMLNNLS